jgi:hypothetical protein
VSLPRIEPPAGTISPYIPAYRATCETAWTGDAHPGARPREWRLSWVVLGFHAEIDGQPWAVYSDDSVALDGTLTNGEDGCGNGDHCGSFSTFNGACCCADALAAQADERGF